jgi:hypothetical protein
MSAVTIQTMSEHDATKLTEKIRITAHNYADARQKLQEYVTEAKAGNAHLALGYASWTAYLAEVLGEEPMRLARGERQEMVQMLSAEGMSTRAIAPIIGATEGTVRNDLRAGAKNYAPEIEGMDGKTYARPELSPEPAAPAPKRRPLTDQSSEAGWDLAKSVEKIERIITDDRFPANREQVTNHLKQHLINSIQSLETLLNTL